MRLVTVALLLFSLDASARVDTLWVRSTSMDKTIGTIIITPTEYEQNNELYPAVFILHGAGGDYGNWLRRMPELEELSNEFGFVFVCPDGEKTSWYLDSPLDSSMKYETYIIDELVPEIDSNYRINKKAITGLSMGGHGALYLSLKNPEVFSIAGSMSGGVDLRPFPGNWDLPKRLGNQEENMINWVENSVVVIANSTDPTPFQFIVDCGTEDFFLEVNRGLNMVLEANGYDYQYSERKGAHNWPYWRESIIHHLKFFESKFIPQ